MPTSPRFLRLAKHVGSRVRALRTARRMSLTDMRDRTGIDPSNQSKIERGEYLTDVERYALIAQALGVPLAVLFRGAKLAAASSNHSRQV